MALPKQLDVNSYLGYQFPKNNAKKVPQTAAGGAHIWYYFSEMGQNTGQNMGMCRTREDIKVNTPIRNVEDEALECR